MDANDRRAIEALFDKLVEAERNSPPRDPEAESFIRDKIARQPAASYYLAQTVIVQSHALEAAEERIRELESRGEGRGGFLGGLFGDGGRRDAPPAGRYAAEGARSPWGGQPQAQSSGGGGFLAGAAQTAMGVAGGVLLGEMIGSLFGASPAHAAGWSGTQDRDSDRDDDRDDRDSNRDRDDRGSDRDNDRNDHDSDRLAGSDSDNDLVGGDADDDLAGGDFDSGGFDADA